MAISAGITAVCGITEPALYGINMRFKTPLLAACVGGATGGLYVGLLHVRNYGGGSPGLMTLPGYIGGDSFHDLIHACIGAAIAFAVSFVVSFILYKDKSTAAVAETEAPAAKPESNADAKTAETSAKAAVNVGAPVSGELIPMNQVNDPTFAQEIMGKGAAIIPEEDVFVSPVNGTVQMVFDTKHAIGFVSDEGAEVLIHVGLDTVNLKGKYFEALVKNGDKVSIGTPVLKADLKQIKKEGYDTVTPVIITNSMEYADVIAGEAGHIEKTKTMMKVI